MTFREMRFPIVWITLVCVALCWLDAAQAGPASRRGLETIEVIEVIDPHREPPSDFMRGPRQLNYPAAEEESGEDDDEGSNEDDEDDEDGRSLRRIAREIAQKPVADVEEESVIPAEVPAPVVDKRPSVLELLSTALDKAIEATSKIPTQQVASDAAGVFHILGQVFSEAIDKVIGGDDGPEEAGETDTDSGEVAQAVTELVAVEDKGPEDPPAPSPDAEPMKAETPEEMSQSDKEIVNNL